MGKTRGDLPPNGEDRKRHVESVKIGSVNSKEDCTEIALKRPTNVLFPNTHFEDNMDIQIGMMSQWQMEFLDQTILTKQMNFDNK